MITMFVGIGLKLTTWWIIETFQAMVTYDSDTSAFISVGVGSTLQHGREIQNYGQYSVSTQFLEVNIWGSKYMCKPNDPDT